MGAKILVVDDTETMRRFHTVLLSAHGYEIETATDGVDALEKIKNYNPALILLDLMMPNMDGIECCSRIKSNDDTKHIKVVMVTSRSEYEMVKKAYAAGCDDYITKPVDQAELTEKVAELLKFFALRQMLRKSK